MAAQPNDVVEQHFELLAETVTGLLPNDEIVVKRGSLPGATTGFDPQPTATLEVVGKVTAAGSATQGYDVRLIDSSTPAQVLATAQFRGSNSQPVLKVGTLNWPSSTKEMAKLSIVAAGLTPGTLDIQKAYIKIHQAGTIKKIIGRVPMGTRQLQATGTNVWSAINDPFIYSHSAADFSPAPTITFRATGQQHACGYFKVRLYDDGNDIEGDGIADGPAGPVSGTEMYFTSLSTQETGALSLIEGHTYRVQSLVNLASCQNQNRSNQINPTVPTGDMLNADLVLSQATTDPDGIDKTVGWFAGVTSATDFNQNAKALNFKFNAPVIALPNVVTGAWQTTVKRVGVAGQGGTVGAYVCCRTTGFAVLPAVNTNDVAYVPLVSASGTDELSLPLAGTSMDTFSSMSSDAAAGKIAASILRVKMLLRDTDAPVLTSPLTSSFSHFSPEGDGVRDAVDLTAVASDFSPFDWRIEVRSASGTLVRYAEGDSGEIAWTWNGTDQAGTVVQDGTYDVQLILTDQPGNVNSDSELSVVVDTLDPVVASFEADVDRFGPRSTPDRASFSGSVQELVDWQVKIRKVGGTPQTLASGQGTAPSVVWTGPVGTGDGTYEGILEAVDLAGNRSQALDSVTFDSIGPIVSNFQASNPAFSPNEDQSRDTTLVTATLADAWSPITYTLDVKLGSTVVRSSSGTGTSLAFDWDGKDASGATVADGTYSASLTVLDAGLNPRSVSLPIVVDTVAPEVLAGSSFPSDHSNTLFSDQPLLVRVLETLSGIDGPTVDFILHEESTGTSTPIQGVYLSGWARATTSGLDLGARYRYELELADLAGNKAGMSQRSFAEGGGFLVTSAAASPTDAYIDPVACTLSNRNAVANTQTATCPNVVLEADPTTVEMGPTFGGGVGYVKHTVSLSSAVLKADSVGLQSQPAFAGQSRELAASFVIQEPDQLMDINPSGDSPVSGAASSLGTVVKTVPATWTSATLEMTPNTATSTVEAVRDPATSSSAVRGHPDPLNSTYLIELKPGTDAATVAGQHVAKFGGQLKHIYSQAVLGYAASLPYMEITRVLAEPTVAAISRDTFVFTPRMLDVPPIIRNPLDETIPTGVSRIGAAKPTQTNFGQDVTVAVLDSGIDADHPDLSSQISQRKVCNGDSTTPDATGHGTHMAGTIAAADNGGGVVGVAPQAHLFDVQVLDKQGGFESDIVCGLDWVYEKRSTVDVVNMSLGVAPNDSLKEKGCNSTTKSLMEAAICKVSGQDILIVAAAGYQDGQQMDEVPAIYNGVLAVTTLRDTDGQRCGRAAGVDDTFDPFAPYPSTSDSGHVLGAPGFGIVSSWPGNKTKSDGGTSSAAAHVSGAAALFQAELNDRGSALMERLISRAEYSHDQYHDCVPVVEGGPHTARAKFPVVVRVDSVVIP